MKFKMKNPDHVLCSQLDLLHGRGTWDRHATASFKHVKPRRYRLFNGGPSHGSSVTMGLRAKRTTAHGAKGDIG